MALSSVSVVMSFLMLRNYRRPSVEKRYGKLLNGSSNTVRLKRVIVRISGDGVAQADTVLVHDIMPGCAMAAGGVCTCNPDECACMTCELHRNGRRQRELR